MKKFLKRIYDIELKMREAVGTRFTYLLIVLAIIVCYFLEYYMGKIIF
ncbi:MAG: hypothetical protein ACLUCH_05105 [Lachnospirales bacterium]|nr:hypothetical protein [Clostridiales bacterium]